MPSDDEVLSSKGRRQLRARAHALKPVVWVAQSGITPGVVREVDRALAAHELIKIHAEMDNRATRTALLVRICAELGAQPVQVIGKMLIAFRARPEEPAEMPAIVKATSAKSRYGAGSRARSPGSRPVLRRR